MDEVSVLQRNGLVRRGLLAGGAATGLTLAAARVEAQTIATDTEGLAVETIALPVPGGSLPAYVARPRGHGPFPLILVNEEVFGLHHYIEDVCRRLAKLGWMAIAPDVYARGGDLGKISDMEKIFAIVAATPDAQMLADLDRAVAWAGAHGGDTRRLGVLGFCRGGRAAWLYAEHSAVPRAAVAFYGPVNTRQTPVQPENPLTLASHLRCPLLGLYGAQDRSIAQADVAAAAAAARLAGQRVEIVVYPDAGHGFHADYRPSYVERDAEDGWRRALAWFRQYGVA